MDNKKGFSDLLVSNDALQPIFAASNSSNLGDALECLIKLARSTDGRKNLATQGILPVILQLLQILSYSSHCHLILLSLKLLRNLCAGEISNQNFFIEHNGVGILSTVFGSAGFGSDPDSRIIGMGLQVLANVSSSVEENQCAIWRQFFPLEFSKIARIQSQDICDPLCMVIYKCCEGSQGLILELCGDEGLCIVAEITRMAAFIEGAETAETNPADGLKLLFSKVCLEQSYFSQLFAKLEPVNAVEKNGDPESEVDCFFPEQAFLVRVLTEILHERLNQEEIMTIPHNFAACVLEIFKNAVGIISCEVRGELALPTGSAGIDVLGYSLTILREISACGLVHCFREGSVDVAEILISSGVLDLLLSLLGDLEPPAIIRKAMKEGEQAARESKPKLCPYRGFRRDLVGVIGNCVYRRKHAQDAIRHKGGILLLLQQCVTDEENPFLREWGILAVRNLLEGNIENQQAVSELEIQGSVDVPEIAGLGLRVEVDPKTRRAKLVNAS